MDLEFYLRAAGALVALAANGFFVATEFALTRVRQYPRSAFEGAPGLERAWEMTRTLEIYLTGCQVGISLFSILFAVLAEPALSTLFRDLFARVGLEGLTPAFSVMVAIALLHLSHIVLGEQVPTYLGVERAREVARWCATPHSVFCWVFWPILKLSDRLAKLLLRAVGVDIRRTWTEEPTFESRPELRSAMGEMLSRGPISQERREEVLQALAIDEIPVRDIMVAREDVRVLSTTRSLAENLDRAGRALQARYPLIGEDLDDFLGIVYVPDLVRHLDELRAGTLTLQDVARPPLEVEADLPVSDLIDRFQAEHQELALVVEDDRIVGLVTATDAFEAITGELEDPLDIELRNDGPADEEE